MNLQPTNLEAANTQPTNTQPTNTQPTDAQPGAEPGSESAAWAGMVGHHEARRRLELAAENPVHAYLFLGRTGTGALQAAYGFAGLLLHHAVQATADGNDQATARERALRLALAGKHPDLMVFEAEGAALRVTEAEEIIRAGLRTPVESDRKVIIVVGVQAIEEAAIGKLLKVIEEPPPSAVFILLADEVPPEIVTIASRCVPVEFGPLSEQVMIDALIAEGASRDRSEVAASAAAGDMDRARLLATDDELAKRAELWAAIPTRLDGSGSEVCLVVEEVQASMDGAQGPLERRHGEELEQLEARVEQLGERGSGRADLVARHKREIRRLRRDELTFGLAVLSRLYRDSLLLGRDPQAETAIAAIQTVAERLTFNPNESLLLQHLLLELSPD